jgi:hypothetical protein
MAVAKPRAIFVSTSGISETVSPCRAELEKCASTEKLSQNSRSGSDRGTMIRWMARTILRPGREATGGEDSKDR